MDNAMFMVKNTALVVAGLLAVFIGLSIIAVIFDVLSWEVLGDWTLKLALIGIVVVILSGVVGMISANPKKK